MKTLATTQASSRADFAEDVTGIILAGGQSTRLGQDKAFIEIGGRTLVERVVDRLGCVVAKIVLVTNSPERLVFLGLPTTPDLIPGVGVVGGLHAGLSAMDTEYGFVVGCDMPFLNVSLMRYLISVRNGYDIVMPRIGPHNEPLHALYGRRCLATIDERIRAGGRRIMEVCHGLRFLYVEEPEIVRHDPDRLSFFNINGADDLERMRALWDSDRTSAAGCDST